MRLGSAIVLLLLLTACGTDPLRATRAPAAPARPVTVAPPVSAPLDRTVGDLADALPHGVDLQPWDLDEKCLTRAATCGDYRGGQGVKLQVTGRSSVGLPELAWVRAVAFTSPQRAQRALARSRAELTADLDGAFSFEPTEPDRNGDYQLGATGRGALATTELGAWRGLHATARFTYERGDGRRTRPVRYVEIVVVRDRYLVQADVRMYAPARPEPAAALAQRLASDVISRLEAAAR